MRSACLLLTIVITSACASDGDDDEAIGEDLSGKADGVSVVGDYILIGGGHVDGDIANLALAADGSYVRKRCYGADCAKLVPETDHYQAIKSSSGKTYLRFERFAWTDFDNRVSKQVQADAYEFTRTQSSIHLRKTYTSRWFTLVRRTEPTLCSASGGVWKPTMDLDGAEAGTTTHCDCGQDPNTFPSKAFVPGEGGCITALATGESDCDDTRGSYTDDDRDKLGDYCLCPIHTAATDQGCKPI